MKKIVVGVDDSRNARAALRWVLDNAASDDEIIAIHVWHLPIAGGFETSMLDPSTFEDGAQETLAYVISDVATDAEAERVQQHVMAGQCANVLLDVAEEADLLVLGARGHGGFAGLLLGSVTNTIVHHAPCPVVIVPDDAD